MKQHLLALSLSLLQAKSIRFEYFFRVGVSIDEAFASQPHAIADKNRIADGHEVRVEPDEEIWCIETIVRRV